MLESIVSTLKSSARSDAFCTKIAVSFEGLSLSVDSLGSVQFPISPRAAKSLIVEAEPAKFGKRDKTILDRQVRDVWEVPQGRIHFQGAWDSTLESILRQVQKNLELPQEGKLVAELHNMLIYMPGQFFQGHQDSEKKDGMVATLIVLLPSEFSGGSLVVDQHGDKQTFPAPREGRDMLTAIAFYSDCHHEVKKVTAGYRVALTYNLIFKTKSKTLLAKENKKLEKALKEYFSAQDIENVPSYESKHPRWFVYLLDHQYTQRSLSWQGLKGTDRERVAELLGSADSLGLTAHLALVDIHETWNTEGDGSWGGYGRRRNYDEEDESDSEDYELTELIEDNIELRHWVDRSGRHARLKEHSVPRGMICWTKAVDEFKPFNTEYEGYMGNYGNTLDRWYHRAALVLWKTESEFAHLFASDKSRALKKISGLLRKDLAKGQDAVRQVLPQWPQHWEAFLEAGLVFEIAVLVQDQETASKLVNPLGLRSLTAKATASFRNLIGAYGEKWALLHLEVWSKYQGWDDQGPLLDLVSLARGLSQRYRKISSWLLEHQFSKIQKNDKEQARSSVREVKRSAKIRFTNLEILFKATLAADEPAIYRRLVQHVLVHPRLYSSVELAKFLLIFKPSWEGITSEKWGHKELVQQVKKRLESESLVKREEGDWSIRDSLSHGCPDCKQLQSFLSNPFEQKLIWPLAKERRQHVHAMIDGLDIPVTHVTHRVGSPQKLVLTKTAALFERDRAHEKALAEYLAKLQNL